MNHRILATRVTTVVDPEQPQNPSVEIDFPTITSIPAVREVVEHTHPSHYRLSRCDEVGIRALLSDETILSGIRNLEFIDSPIDQSVLDRIASAERVTSDDIETLARICRKNELRETMRPTIGMSKLESLSFILNEPTSVEARSLSIFCKPISLTALADSTALSGLKKLTVTLNHPGNSSLLEAQRKELGKLVHAAGLDNLTEIVLLEGTQSDLKMPTSPVQIFVDQLAASRRVGLQDLPLLHLINGEPLTSWGINATAFIE